MALPPLSNSKNPTIYAKEAAPTEKTINADFINTHTPSQLNSTKRTSFHQSLSRNGFHRLQEAERIAQENERMAKKLLKALY